MAASFVSASAQGLFCATHPLVAYPYTVGLWARPTTNGVEKAFFSLIDTAAANQFNTVTQGAADAWTISARAGGTIDSVSVGTVTANQWAFIVARFISATNNRLSVLQYDGSAVAVQRVTSRAFPTSAETIALGVRPVSPTPDRYFDGQIGEFWYTATDIQEDGDVLQDALLRQLAYGGPFSVPHIAKDIIEYRSLRKHPTSDGDQIGEQYHGRFGRQVWTNVNGVLVANHPPLPYSFKRPDAPFSARTMAEIAAASGAVAPPAGIIYPQLERGLRGVNRGVALGSYR